ncbi:DUF2878 domain-containing protein [Eionea flava]
MHNPLQNSWKLILNIGLFQAGWFACLLLPIGWSLGIVIAVLVTHFSVVVPHAKRGSECLLIGSVLIVGVLIESFYLWSHALVLVDGSSLPPIWLLFIWLLFATTFRYSLEWLRPKLILAAIFAGIAAPMSYLAGANLNASVSLNENIGFSLFLIGGSWAIAFPLMMRQFVSLANINDEE